MPPFDLPPKLWLPPKPAIIRPAEPAALQDRKRDLLKPLPGVIFISSAGFQPDDIANLQFWFRSDLGVTKDGSDFVSQWDDQSGNARHLSEATNKPLWVASLINGNAAIRFDGSDDLLKTADFAIATPWHIFIVFNVVSWVTNERIYCLDNDASANGALRNVTASGTAGMLNGGTAGPSQSGFTVGAFKLASCLFNDVSSTLICNDGSAGTSGSDMDFTSDGLTLGTTGAALAFSNIEVAELIGYSAEISGTDLTNLKTYINSRYALW